jgi:hypothetical protein
VFTIDWRRDIVLVLWALLVSVPEPVKGPWGARTGLRGVRRGKLRVQDNGLPGRAWRRRLVCELDQIELDVQALPGTARVLTP